MSHSESLNAELATILATVVKRRWPKEPFENALKEDWLHAAMESDPIVLLEAAWEAWAVDGSPFRPSPGELLKRMRDRVMYISTAFRLPQSLMRAKAAQVDPTISIEGIQAVIGRFGARRWEVCMAEGAKPSDEEAWTRCTRDQIVFAHAKKAMAERGSPPWRQTEVDFLPPVSTGAMRSLRSPATTNETDHDDFRAKLSGLADNKRLS